jgi:hypothetical protein
MGTLDKSLHFQAPGTAHTFSALGPERAASAFPTAAKKQLRNGVDKKGVQEWLNQI